jgi:hypothetical protein
MHVKTEPDRIEAWTEELPKVQEKLLEIDSTPTANPAPIIEIMDPP